MVVKKKAKPVRKAPARKTKEVDIIKDKKVVRKKKINVSDRAEVLDGVYPTSNKLQKQPPEGYATVGMGIGATINMGDYESARVDVFIQRNVKDDDRVLQDAYRDMGELLNNELQEQVSQLVDEDE